MLGGTKGFVPVLHAATSERPDEVDTLTAAQAVAGALANLGFAAEIVGVSLDLGKLQALADRRPLIVFNLIDAIAGDCRLAPLAPALLEQLGLAYTGASATAWLDTLSKTGTKLKLAQAGLPTPAWSEDGGGLGAEQKMIVKPDFEHGSLGLDASSVMQGAGAAQAIIERNARFRTKHFAEAFVEGREFNVALLERDGAVEVLPIAEMLFEGFGSDEPRIVGYDAKWMPESAAYIGTPRRFGVEIEEPGLACRLSEIARTCWTLFGLAGYARVDFRVDCAGQPFVLEVNVNPCLSPDAGFAAAAARAGLSYDALIAEIVEASLGELQATA